MSPIRLACPFPFCGASAELTPFTTPQRAELRLVYPDIGRQLDFPGDAPAGYRPFRCPACLRWCKLSAAALEAVAPDEFNLRERLDEWAALARMPAFDDDRRERAGREGEKLLAAL